MDKLTNKKALTIAVGVLDDIIRNGEVYGIDCDNWGFPSAEVVAKLEGMIATLDKKAASTKGKPTKTQAENEAYKAKILEFLLTQEKGVTATEIANACNLSSNQKATVLLRALVDAGEVVKVVQKGKSLFSVAAIEVEGE